MANQRRSVNRAFPRPSSLDLSPRPLPTPRTVVVPLSNPDTAADLLRVAHMLCNGGEGRIVACFVFTGDQQAEEHHDLVAALRGGDAV